MLRDRKELEHNLIATIDKIKHDKTKINKVKKGMKEYNVLGGDVQKIFNHAERELSEIDLRLLCLLTEQAYIASGDINIKFDDYFTEIEIKSSRQYSGDMEREEELEYPVIVNNVIMIDDENYIGVVDADTISQWFRMQLLRYNYDTQREHRSVRRQNTIEKAVKLNAKSVKEITEHALNNTLEITMITLNALIGTSDSNEEISYISRTRQLQINRGSFLDIVDGMHRLTGTMNALEINPDLGSKIKFQVAFKNFNTSRAQKHLAQISKINEINRTHIEYLEESRYSDTVVKQLQRESDLKGKVSQTNRLHLGEIVAYNTLADTIDEVFKMESKKEALLVSKYLTDYFDYLIGSYPDYFINKIEEMRQISLLGSNPFFAGYIVLAKRLKENNISFTKVTDILDKIDFSRNNPMWEELEVLDDGSITANARKKIKEYFSKLDIKESVITND